jgi:hypothetical protein
MMKDDIEELMELANSFMVECKARGFEVYVAIGGPDGNTASNHSGYEHHRLGPFLSVPTFQKLHRAILHNIGDHRTCPRCMFPFIPNDQTVADLIEINNEIFLKS